METTHNKNNGNKKGTGMDIIDTDINTAPTTLQTSDQQQQQQQQQQQEKCWSYYSESLFGTTNHQPSNTKNEDPPAPEENVQNLYKTEMCRNWEEQKTCRYGNRCQYAHGVEDLRYVQRHPRYKTIRCRTFDSTGDCPYGKRCTFLHEEKVPSDRSSRVRQDSSSTLKQGTSSLTSTSPSFLATAGPPYSPPLEVPIDESVSSSSSLSSPPQPLPTFSPSTQLGLTSPFLQQHRQYSLHEQNQPDHGKQPLSYFSYFQHQQQPKSTYCSLNQNFKVTNHQQTSESCLSKDLFTDTGGFSCAIGFSPPLPSLSKSDITALSYFSSSSSTVTTSSSSSSISPTRIMDHNYPFFH
ncbi:unnamed protein product [Absidia cylindrospora]